MKTALEIIDESEQYYSDPSKRGVNQLDSSARYAYVSDNGNMCAVGRCAENPAELPAKTVNPEWFKDKLLKPEYRGQPISFWARLQWAHDCDSNFTLTGISKKGSFAFQSLRNQS